MESRCVHCGAVIKEVWSVSGSVWVSEGVRRGVRVPQSVCPVGGWHVPAPRDLGGDRG